MPLSSHRVRSDIATESIATNALNGIRNVLMDDRAWGTKNNDLPDFNFLTSTLRCLFMKPPFTLGVVGHFGVAVRNPKQSAQWFQRVLGLRKEFEFEDGVAVGNENVTIVLFKGRPSPETIGHMSFHLPDMATLRKALAYLKRHDVDLEDPGDEIGPEAPGSPHMGLWFHDLDGYRWELSVQGGK